MKKSFLALLLSLTLAVSLSACGKKDDENATEPSEETTAATEEVTEDTTELESESEETKPQSAEKPEEKATEKPAEKPTEVAEAVDLGKVRTEIINTIGISDAMMIETPSLLNLYGIEASQVKQSASFTKPSGVFPHEIIMVEAVSESAAKDISELLNNRLSEVLVQSETYDEENYKIAQQCKVIKNNNFVALFLSPDQAQMRKIYGNYVKD